MTKTEDAAVYTTVSDTELQEGLAGGTAHGAAAAPQKASQKSTFVILSDYVLEMPMKVRLPVYNKVSAAVRDGELFGLMHATNQVDILLLDAKNKEVTRSFRQVLVSNSAAVLERLEQISTAAVIEEVIRTGGRNFSVEELNAMGDDLDFDAMAAAARKREVERNKGKLAKNRKKPKTTT